MSDTWADITPAKTNISANDLATVVNQLIANERLLKGGVAATAPTSNLEIVIAAQLLDGLAYRFGSENRTLTGTLTMDSTFKRTQFIDVNGANRIVKLPSSGIIKGDAFEIGNPSISYYCDVQGYSSGSVWKFWEGSILVRANQDAPTTSAHWDIIRKYTASVRVTVRDGAGAYTANTDIDFSTVTEDTHSAWASNQFTAPKDGTYHVQFSTTADGTGIMYFGSASSPDSQNVMRENDGTNALYGSGDFKLNKGDVVSFKSTASWTGAARKRGTITLVSY